MQVLESRRFFEIITGYVKCLEAKEALSHNIASMKLECVQNNGQLSLWVIMVFKVPENVFIVSLYMFSYILVKHSLFL